MLEMLYYIPDPDSEPESEPEPEHEPAKIEMEEESPVWEAPVIASESIDVPSTAETVINKDTADDTGLTTAEDPLVSTPKPVKTKKVPKIKVKTLVLSGFCVFSALWVLQNYYADIPLEQLKKQYALSESRFISINGMEAHVRISGKGEPVLLLHDAYGSLHTWINWTKILEKHYQVISVDLPGFGLTGPAPDGQYTAMMYDQFLDTLALKLNLSKFHLVGNGLGAKIAWMYAKEPENRLNKLVLLNAPGFEKNESKPWFSTIAKLPVLHTLTWYITPKSYVHAQITERFSDEDAVSDSLTQRYFDLLLRPGNRKAISDRAQSNEKWPEAGNNISKINVPVMIVWGADDRCISSKNAYLFHQKMPQSALRVYPRTGHWPQEENPEKSVEDVMKFLEGKF